MTNINEKAPSTLVPGTLVTGAELPWSSVTLKCLKEKNKLRVRIISPGYYNNANCQFPRNIRLEGRIYQSRVSGIKLAK